MKAFLGLGSNMGDRLGMLQHIVDLLSAGGDVTVLRSSRVYETTPVGGPEGQPDFLNAVIEVETTLDAHALLKICLGVENELGRVRAEINGPRTADVDILNYGREAISDDELTVPHPRMHERMFALAPLLELDADPLLPGGRKVATLQLAGGADPFGVRPFAPPLEVPS
jgi:2-amino-4-hydroxy-6-hydroxymethyldihydropteridine diphosphokinase